MFVISRFLKANHGHLFMFFEQEIGGSLDMIKGSVKGTRTFGQKSKPKILYEDLFNEYYRCMEIRGRSQETLRTYKYHSKYFGKFLNAMYGEKVYCDVICLEMFENYIRYLQDKIPTYIDYQITTPTPIWDFSVVLLTLPSNSVKFIRVLNE